MHHNNYNFQFCPVCGGDLRSTALKEHEPERLVCAECGFVFYLDPKLVACAIVEIEDKIILLRRSISPQKGQWVVPGGYVDRGEEVAAAAIRETREECGIDIRIRELLGIYSYPGWLEAVVIYVTDYVGGNLIADDECMEVKLLSHSEIPWDKLAFRSTRDALTDYYKLKGE